MPTECRLKATPTSAPGCAGSRVCYQRQSLTRGDQGLKIADGDALTRAHIQFDLLSFVFGNAHFVFTPPQYPNSAPALFPTDRQWTFAELYLDCLANTPKAARTLREKMAESQNFAVGFAKVGLLVNSGRLNTTMALNPEVKTHLRTYHPIPSIQLDEFTRRHIPDAPRMKAQVKSCMLPHEVAGPPEGLRAIAERAAAGFCPSTTPTNLIFWLFAEHAYVTERYMPSGFDFHRLFYDMNDVRSNERAEAFLAIVHRFLETPHCLADLNLPPDAKINLGFGLHHNAHAVSQENQDAPEELAFAQQQKQLRLESVARFEELEREKAAATLDSTAVATAPVRSRGRGKDSYSRTQTPAMEGGPSVALRLPFGHAVLQTVEDTRPLSADLHHIRLCVQLVDMLPVDQTWTGIIKKDAGRRLSLVRCAWLRTLRDAETGRDAIYSSDEEDLNQTNMPSSWSPCELAARLSPGFIVHAPTGGLARCRYALAGQAPKVEGAEEESTPVKLEDPSDMVD